MERIVGISVGAHSLIEDTVAKGRFEFNKDSYRKALSLASKRTRQTMRFVRMVFTHRLAIRNCKDAT